MAELQLITDPRLIPSASHTQRLTLALLHPLAKDNPILALCRSQSTPITFTDPYLQLGALCTAWRTALRALPPMTDLIFDVGIPEDSNVDWHKNMAVNDWYENPNPSQDPEEKDRLLSFRSDGFLMEREVAVMVNTMASVMWMRSGGKGKNEFMIIADKHVVKNLAPKDQAEFERVYGVIEDVDKLQDPPFTALAEQLRRLGPGGRISGDYENEGEIIRDWRGVELRRVENNLYERPLAQQRERRAGSEQVASAEREQADYAGVEWATSEEMKCLGCGHVENRGRRKATSEEAESWDGGQVMNKGKRKATSEEAESWEGGQVMDKGKGRATREEVESWERAGHAY